MFLKYPRSVRMKINQDLYNKGISIIKEDYEGDLLYKVTDELKVCDIKHKTEIYSKYGKCKILNMNLKWYLYIEPSCVLIRKSNDRRYQKGFCEFISEDCSEEELLFLYLHRLKKMKVEYLDYKIDRFNKRMSTCLDEAHENLKTLSANIYYDRNCSEMKYSHFTEDNLKKLHHVIKVVEELREISQSS